VISFILSSQLYRVTVAIEKIKIERKIKMRGCVPVLILFAAMAVTVAYGDFPASYLPLQRSIPLNHKVELTTLRARDRVRHGRILQGGGGGGILDFSVQGTSDPYLVG
jgi:hypothetical protein